MLDPRALMTLRAIEREGSFSAVARKTGWSQPSISRQITELEKECGAALVRRTSHGVTLTQLGSMLSRYGELITNRVLQAEHEIKEFRGGLAAHVQLLAPPSICSTIAARALVQVGQHSDVEVSLEQSEPQESIAALLAGRADCALIFSYDSLSASSAVSDELSVERLGRDPMLLMVRNGDSLVHDRGDDRSPVKLDQLSDRHWIAGCTMCQANLLRLAGDAGFSPMISHSTEDWGATQNLVEMGLGVSIVPRLATRDYIHPDLELFPIADDLAFRNVEFVVRRNDDRDSLAVLRSAVRTAARTMLQPA